MAKPRVLVLVDDVPTRTLIRKYLRAEFTVLETENGANCLPLVQQEAPDLVLLDQVVDHPLPDVPVIMLTGTGEVPYWATELPLKAHRQRSGGEALVKHVHLVLDRSNHIIPGRPIITCGGLVIGMMEHRAVLRGRTLQLTRNEFHLLAMLATNAGRVVTREQLVEHVRGSGSTLGPHVLDVHVAAVRKALGDDQAMLSTVRNSGYLLTPLP
jgi:two-component system, OmpR family, alkaline phosphatase synthesis response regulator PhoP